MTETSAFAPVVGAWPVALAGVLSAVLAGVVVDLRARRGRAPTRTTGRLLAALVLVALGDVAAVVHSHLLADVAYLTGYLWGLSVLAPTTRGLLRDRTRLLECVTVVGLALWLAWMAGVVPALETGQLARIVPRVVITAVHLSAVVLVVATLRSTARTALVTRLLVWLLLTTAFVDLAAAATGTTWFAWPWAAATIAARALLVAVVLGDSAALEAARPADDAAGVRGIALQGAFASVLAVPLVLDRGSQAQALAVLGVAVSLPIVALSTSARLVLAQRRVNAVTRELEAAAGTDPLTGLANRRSLQALLEHRVAAGRDRFAILFVDLDGFKLVNDSLGHAAGDEVLDRIAVRLRAAVRPTDVLARFGGDEFAVVVDLTHHAPAAAADELGADPREVEAVAERLLEAVRRPLRVRGVDIPIDASIGIRLAGPGSDAVQLLRDADAAMYAAKSAGRGQAMFHTPAITHRVSRELSVQQGLREALARGELLPAYQPVRRLLTDETVGVEALARWRHPRLGLLPAGQFVPLVEHSHLVRRIGEVMLRTATTDLARLDAAPSVADPGCWVSVNVTPAQLLSGELLDEITGALERTGLEPSRLLVEVVESQVLDVEPVRAVLRTLRTLGVGVALDDFGAGFATIRALTTLPISVVKIDRRFIAEAATVDTVHATLRAMLTLAGDLGLTTLAEGIETPAQRAMVTGLGCELGQGFLLGRPDVDLAGQLRCGRRTNGNAIVHRDAALAASAPVGL